VDDWTLPRNGQVIRLCVDLNVWVRYLLGIRRGTAAATTATATVTAASSGNSTAGPMQLIVSHTMLSRLEDVLLRLDFPTGDSSAFCSLVGAFARRGPAGVAPHLVLGGGTASTAKARLPVYDPYDPLIVPPRADDEDGRVLATAIAGRAHILATYNFKDFTSPNTTILAPGRVQGFRAVRHNVLVMHADAAAALLRSGEPPGLSTAPESAS
jgi:hypothetical protein